MKRLNETFTNFADWVSSAMGTPQNILFWLVAVLAWFVVFAVNPGLQNSNFLPAWFTSQAFNFPLNSITTLAELYIGFLVAAAANRVERHNDLLLEKIEKQEEKNDLLLEKIDKQEKLILQLLNPVAKNEKPVVKSKAVKL